MISKFSIKDFKAFSGKHDLKFAPITLIYGPNSAGKSSVIQSLMLLKQSITRPSENGELVSHGEYVDLGTFSSMVNGHDVRKSIDFSLEYMASESIRPRVGYFSLFGSKHKRQVKLSYVLSDEGCVGKNEEFTYLNGVDFGACLPNEGNNFFNFGLISKLSGQSKVLSLEKRIEFAKRYSFNSEESRDRVASYLMKKLDQSHEKKLRNALNQIEFISDLSYSTPSSVNFEMQDAKNNKVDGISIAISGAMLNSFSQDLQDKFNDISYLGPLRSYPSRLYAPKGDQSGSVGKTGENAARLIYEKSPKITEEINNWFKSFEIPYCLTVDNIGNAVTGTVISLQLEDLRTGVIVGPSDVGFGIGQLLPIIVEGVVREKSIICVEQPEIHLHPRLQANIADFLISSIQKPNGNQWIIETHSESLMLRIQNQIRRGIIKPEDVSVIYIEPSNLGGNIVELPMDKDGDFMEEWPQGFFEERFNEVFGRS